MNKSKIEWCDYTWNPVTGCLHGCEFCYARRIDNRFGNGKFMPTFHPERLQQPLKVKKPSKIFVGSVSDLFGDWLWKASHVLDSSERYTRVFVASEILKIVKQCPQHTFIFLTKNPKGMQDMDFPENCWCGTSAENQEKANERVPELLGVRCETRFISIEPIMGAIDLTEAMFGIDYPGHSVFGFTDGFGYEALIQWIIVGAQTGPGAVPPDQEWIADIAGQCMAGDVPLFIKDNCKWPVVKREFPREGGQA